MPTTTLSGDSAPRIYIPTDSDVFSKIVITDDDAVDYTVLDTYGGVLANNYLINNASIIRSATDRLASFNFTISNIDGVFLNKFNGGEVVKFYVDTTDATTEIFRGKIDNVKYGLSLSSGFIINIDGRAYPEVIDKTITGIEAAARSDISLAGILNEFFSDVTLTFWNGSEWVEATYTLSTDTVSWSASVSTYPSTLINTSYQHKKGWTVITNICKEVGLECYLEYTGNKWTLRTFVADSITNTGSNIAYGVNLIDVGKFGKENTDILNRVIVYGKTESDNILILKTENDTTSQDNLWIKDIVVTDGALETMEKVQSKSNFELAQSILNPDLGRVTTVCLPTLKPGELITVSVPYCNIDGNYKIQSITHSLGNFCTTTVELAAKIRTVGDLFIPKLNPEEAISRLDNPNNMTDSYTVFFDTDSGVMTHSGTEESSGALRLQSGQTTGFTIANTITTDQNVTYCEFRKSENFEIILDVYEVSNTGGITWETFNPDSNGVHKFAIASNKLRFKMTLNRTNAGDTSPAYQSVSLLYK